ncbi:hypothetical protein BDF20DRAFT_56802 [Mycotypha africana]|uniref:uncharacterized protein n=1 Tax=Mycotypha africana TaxID=64632 RepID=UPI0023014BDB|nr:uncharacterized protein BDF20DRAFT_56802 [Mycotypha africana]KAI8991703.1 hypothetical protein BDF20DRAFT_56802 [Mycotypha africana]
MITCPICYDELLNVQTESAALSCGHVFHNTCIKECLNRKKECPICRTSVNPRKDVNQLYFTSTDDAQQSSSVALPLITTSDEATLEILSLRKSIQQLMDDIRALKKSTEESISAKTKIILAKDKEIDALQIKLKNKTDSLRFVQQLRKVADLDAELSSERTRKLGKKLEKSTRDELLVYALAIHANAERAREVANLDYKNALFEISRLRKQNERLKRTVEVMMKLRLLKEILKK